MNPARDIRLVLISNTIAYFAFRFTQIALPLVVLHEFNSAALAGLVGGLAGIPVVTSPWWARRLRQRLADGPGLALVTVWQAAAIVLLPVSLLLGFFNPIVLGIVGMAVGVSDALGAPGRIALLGDLSDRLEMSTSGVTAPTGEAATRLVTWDDALRRAAMVIGPALAGVGVTLGWTQAMLWVEGFGLILSAVLISRVRSAPVGSRHVIRRAGPGVSEPAPGILESVRMQPDILRGWVMRGTSCLSWFAFTLGIASLGQRTGQLGLQATAMTAYGIGCFVTTVAIASRPATRPPLRTAAWSWAGTGFSFAAMSLWTTPAPVALVSAACGAITVVGIRSLTFLLLQQTAGGQRRAALAGQSIVVDVTVAIGMLGGGLLIDRFGPQPVLFASGLVTALVAFTASHIPGRSARKLLDRLAPQPALAP